MRLTRSKVAVTIEPPKYGAQTGHQGVGGLQQHSVGDLYPWSVRGVGNTLQAFQLITGEQGQPHPYVPDQKDSFEAAHQKAEQDCLRMKNEVND